MTEHGGCAYRLGGDEFCVLASAPGDRAREVTAAASLALTEHGAGFHITASYGSILLPQESQDPTEAMRLVDQRMYGHKTSSRRSPDRQSRDVLLRVLRTAIPSWPSATPPWPAWSTPSPTVSACRPTSAFRPGRRPSA
jgi:hypothetical protein